MGFLCAGSVQAAYRQSTSCCIWDFCVQAVYRQHTGRVLAAVYGISVCRQCGISVCRFTLYMRTCICGLFTENLSLSGYSLCGGQGKECIGQQPFLFADISTDAWNVC